MQKFGQLVLLREATVVLGSFDRQSTSLCIFGLLFAKTRYPVSLMSLCRFCVNVPTIPLMINRFLHCGRPYMVIEVPKMMSYSEKRND